MSHDSNPPGITGEWKTASEGGPADEWQASRPVKHFTNAFIICKAEGKILLGMKKRGFGVGKWNGFGGKVDTGESLSSAALRELKEEANITAPLVECGTLLFSSDNTDFAYLIHIFRGDEWADNPAETEEMRPQWFSATESARVSNLPPIPFEDMWSDDPLWFPFLIKKLRFAGRVDFVNMEPDGSGGTIAKFWFGVVSE